MLGFDWWWVLLLLPVPFWVRRLVRPAERAELALTVPLLEHYSFTESGLRSSANRFASLCCWLFWICLVLAASRPFWLGDPISRTVSGRDLVLAVDISGSMSEMDMTINSNAASRIDVLKVVAEKFIDRRDGDRLGLILFGTNAYNFVPLTFDLETLKELLLDVSTGLAGRHTAIGDAIGLAIKSMREQDSAHKVLILVTDGSSTAGFENPIVAAQAARQQGMTIYTIGVGNDEETLARTYGLQNVPPGIALNERVLIGIARATEGRYFRAIDTDSLEKIYLELDQLEPIEHEYRTHRPRQELFSLPLAAAILILLLYIASSIRQSRQAAVK